MIFIYQILFVDGIKIQIYLGLHRINLFNKLIFIYIFNSGWISNLFILLIYMHLINADQTFKKI